MEKEIILRYWQDTVRTYPDKTALVFMGKAFTYSQVDNLSDRIAAHLQKNFCVKTESIVGVMIDRSELQAIYPLAIMKCGAAYMPLDPHFPEDRLAFMCQDAGVSLILADDGLVQTTMPSWDKDLFQSSQISALPDDKATLPDDFGPSSLLVILYTSGSTGKPKGVMLEQAGLVNWCKGYIGIADLNHDDTTLAYANFGFDAHMIDLYPTFMLGATVHILDNDTRLDLVAINEYIETNNITALFLTTQIAYQMTSLFDMPSVKVIATGGEKLPPMHAPKNHKFLNVYGPTEATLTATIKQIDPFDDGRNLGHAQPGYEIVIIDPQLNEVGTDTEGELLIIGIGVGRGYLNRPDVTAEKFITWHGKRAYRTGDAAKMLSDGTIEFIGRMDGQVKLRGLRIELGEVESAMLKHPAIGFAAAAVKEIAGTGHLFGYYQLKEGMDTNAEDIKDVMAQTVTDFMIPEEFILIDTVPYTPNGKVDKRALPVPAVNDNDDDSDDDDAPRQLNRIELMLSDMLCQLIGTDSVSITKPLKLCGLTSLLAMRFAVGIHKAFGVKLTGKELMSGTCIVDVENVIMDALLSRSAAPTLQSPTPNTQHPTPDTQLSAPLTHAQQGVYIDCLRNPDSIAYNLPYILHFPSDTDTDAIIDSIKDIVEVHPALSIVFDEKDGEYCQMISKQEVVVPVRTLSAADAEAYKADFIRPFDLSAGPLYRYEIIKTDTDIRLFIDMHHLVCDGGSYDMFVKQLLSRMMHGGVETETCSYITYAISQHDNKQRYDECKAFFAEQLKEFDTATEIPADKSGEADHGEGIVVKAATDMAAINEYAKTLGVSPSAVFLAATFYVASRFTNSKQVYLGTISNGRSNVDVADTMGMFVNTLPLACKIADQTVLQFVLQCADTFNTTIDHEDYPFAQIAADFGFQPNLMFEYQVGVLEKYMLDGKEVQLESLDEGAAKFKTAVRIWDDGVTIEYNTAYYENATMQRMANCISATASAIVTAAKDSLMKHVSMLDDIARNELDGIRHTCLDAKAIRFPLFHNSVEYWAEQTPDATALIACNETLTYREFNEKANILANALINKGVVPGDRVCLLLPRKSWHLIAMFGVMKAGAAYIPCDPEYPAERINLITEDSHARYVITTSDKMEPYGERALNIEALLAEDMPKANPAIEQSSDSLAYLIYTSGSTGRPKGVMLHHRGICNYLTPHVENRHIYAFNNECKAMMGITTVSFDLSLKELGATFYNGKTLVFANEDEIMSPILMAELFKRTGCDGFNGTPSRLKMFLELPEFQEVIKDVKVIILGGEKYPATLIPQLRSLTEARLFNTYGPTEITVSSNVGELTHEEKVTVGEPLLNYHEYVVDADDNELPVGVVGELLIGGLAVGHGYNDLPEKTAEAFITYQGQRVYRSGDYARWMPNGKVEILGRKDHQIKLNGLRIELGEVETVLNRQLQVKEGVVMIKKVENRDHLVAYFVASDDSKSLSKGDLEDLLKSQMGKSLTHYMVPTIFMQLDKMPISPNGKTDLKSLPEPIMAEREYVEAANDIEKFFCEAFATILDREKVGATDNFFEIGGTSLIAMRVVMSAAKAGYKVVYKNVFDNPTPRKLATLLGAAPVAEKANTQDKLQMQTASGIISNPDDPEASNYDYTKINAQLSKNELATLNSQAPRKLGTCLVTGATGYLGIHVVHELIQRDDVPAVYCMVRAGKTISAESRLRTQLFYYFGDSYSHLFGKRIFVIDGDVTNTAWHETFMTLYNSLPQGRAGEGLQGSAGEGLLTLFNCAANVKHFSAGTDIEDINIGGCQTCIDFCLKTGARFIQTSTHSISGYTVGENAQSHLMTEKELYWGQNLDNQYIHAKFLAERNVLEAVVEKGLDGKIVRLGNLSARSTDGEFQINFSSNSFMGRLRALQTVGCAPYDMSSGTVEFSPINEVAAAVVLLAMTPRDCTVFNPVNAHRQVFDDVLVCLNRLGIKIDLVEPSAFSERLAAVMEDPDKAAILQSLMAYQSSGTETVVENSDNYTYTTQVLLRLGFRWNFTTWDYMERFITAIQGLGFFDDDYQR